MKIEHLVVPANGMTCRNCETILQNALMKEDGVKHVTASYRDGTVSVRYDAQQTDKARIKARIQQAGYDVATAPSRKRPAWINAVIILALLLIAYQLLSRLGVFTFLPQVQAGSSLIMLFLVGVMTSVHCIAMCGGINLSAVAARARQNPRKSETARAALLYNGGRIVSYTITGAVAGALGLVLSLSELGRNLIMIVAGVFMVLMGLNILGYTPWLRKIRMPMPRALVGLQARMSKSSSFLVGLFNGLMPCGPLQTMQLYALGTGSVIMGALSMMVFAVGTVPLMFGIGFIAGALTGRKSQVIKLASALLVILLGFQMLGRAVDLPMLIQARQASTQVQAAGVPARMEDGYQIVETRFANGRYQPITVQAGVPVRWIISAQEGDLNGCNNSILINEYNIAQDLQYGETIVEFFPEEVGIVRYTCWMNMISSRITIVDDLGQLQ